MLGQTGNYLRHVARNFEGRGVLFELGHFDKHSPTTWETKAPQGKIYGFFCQETLKNFILNEKFHP